MNVSFCAVQAWVLDLLELSLPNVGAGIWSCTTEVCTLNISGPELQMWLLEET